MPKQTLDELAIGIDREHDQYEQSIAGALDHAWNAGRLLIEAKKQLPHGEFMPWVAIKTKVSHAQATTYMRVGKCKRLTLSGHSTIASLIRELQDPRLSELETEDWLASRIRTLQFRAFDRCEKLLDEAIAENTLDEDDSVGVQNAADTAIRRLQRLKRKAAEAKPSRKKRLQAKLAEMTTDRGATGPEAETARRMADNLNRKERSTA